MKWSKAFVWHKSLGIPQLKLLELELELEPAPVHVSCLAMSQKKSNGVKMERKERKLKGVLGFISPVLYLANDPAFPPCKSSPWKNPYCPYRNQASLR